MRAARPLLVSRREALLWTTEPLAAEAARTSGASAVRFPSGARSRAAGHPLARVFHVKHLPRAARVLAVANQKGGVGKTTTAISLAAALAVLERDVLLVDFDPQGNATSGLGVDKSALSRTTYDWLLGEAAFEEVARRHGAAVPDARAREPRPRGRRGGARERGAPRVPAGRRGSTRSATDSSTSSSTARRRSSLLTLNALVAADGVLVPIQCEYFALEGVSELLATIERVKESLNPDLELAGVVATMWDERTNLSRAGPRGDPEALRRGRLRARRSREASGSARRRPSASRSSSTTSSRRAPRRISRSRASSCGGMAAGPVRVRLLGSPG